MTPSKSQLEALIRLCTSSNVSHRADVLALLSEAEVGNVPGARIEVHDVTASRELVPTYHVRAEHLTRLEETGSLTAPSPSGRRLPATLAEDVRRLSARLTEAKDQPVQIWSINLADRTAFIIFVLVRDDVIAGVVRSVSEVGHSHCPPSDSSNNL